MVVEVVVEEVVEEVVVLEVVEEVVVEEVVVSSEAIVISIGERLNLLSCISRLRIAFFSALLRSSLRVPVASSGTVSSKTTR